MASSDAEGCGWQESEPALDESYDSFIAPFLFSFHLSSFAWCASFGCVYM